MKRTVAWRCKRRPAEHIGLVCLLVAVGAAAQSGANAAESVTVTPSSWVRLGRLYAEVDLVSWNEDPRGPSIQVTIARLEVVGDGRHVEERDFPALGLREAG